MSKPVVYVVQRRDGRGGWEENDGSSRRRIAPATAAIGRADGRRTAVSVVVVPSLR
jgi:hypothetical protein